MGLVHAAESVVLDARPEDIYTILVDYRNEHARILPPQYFTHLTVEEGGAGAGTVFRTQVRVMGQTRDFHMAVSEPELGRVLRETDLDTGLATTFTLTPVDNGQRTRLEIRSEWQNKGGLSGWLDSLTTPSVMRRIYRSQFQQMAQYLKTRTGQV